MKKKINVIDRAIELGLIKREKMDRGFGEENMLVIPDDNPVDDIDKTQEWETLENWINQQRNIIIKINGEKLIKKLKQKDNFTQPKSDLNE